MSSSAKSQPWTKDQVVMDYRVQCAAAGMPTELARGRMNFYPQGAMMFNGGQGAGDGGRQVLYDTEAEKQKKAQTEKKVRWLTLKFCLIDSDMFRRTNLYLEL